MFLESDVSIGLLCASCVICRNSNRKIEIGNG